MQNVPKTERGRWLLIREKNKYANEKNSLHFFLLLLKYSVMYYNQTVEMKALLCLNQILYLWAYTSGYTDDYTVNDYMSTWNGFYQHDADGVSPQTACRLQLCIH